MWKFILIFLLGSVQAVSNGNYRFEGVFQNPDGERRFFLVAYYLPYNPNVLVINSNPEKIAKCNKWWPKGTVFSEEPAAKETKIDFLWVETEGQEIAAFDKIYEVLNQATVIYTTTHFQENHYQKLKFFLEAAGFTLLSHWYWEGLNGHAIFLRKNIFDVCMKSLNFSPQVLSTPIGTSTTGNLERVFQKAENKSNNHSMEAIDFIYMINLDERPEKFALAAGNLHLYGIYPYRFSAVNGWKLPLDAINQIGVNFSSFTTQEKFMGSVFKKIDGCEFINHELIEKPQETYFALGISRGAIGVLLSHLSILQDSYDAGYNTVWVMEDDVDIIEDPLQIPAYIRELDQLAGDWDILFTDTDTKDSVGNHIPCRALASRPNYPIQPISSFLERFHSLNANLSRIGMRYGTYSMIIRRSGMEKILKYYKEYGVFLPYDADYWLVPDLKMYCFNKDVVSHMIGAPSDNSEPSYLKKAQ